MKKLTLTNHAQNNTTVLENEFIDQYMIKANGEYVKVYLLLLRHSTGNGSTLSVSRIADLLEVTEKDVVRALNYWKKEGLLEYEAASEAKTTTAAESAPAVNTSQEAMSASHVNVPQEAMSAPHVSVQQTSMLLLISTRRFRCQRI